MCRVMRRAMSVRGPNATRSKDFAVMSSPVSGRQNYLLMMRGYNAFERGYMGNGIFRNSASGNIPVTPDNTAGGGKPVTVALVTANGISPTGSAIRGDITWSDSASALSPTYKGDKYLNYTSEGGAEINADKHDFSGHNMVFNSASDESDLAKIVAGWEYGGRAEGDLYGFVPNGRLEIYRTGGGKAIDGGVIGSFNSGTNQVTIGGTTYNLNPDGTFVGGRKDGNFVYLDSGNEYEIFSDGNVYQLKNIAYQNWRAIRNAIDVPMVDRANVIANVSLIPDMRSSGTLTVSGLGALLTELNVALDSVSAKQLLGERINSYYANGTSDTNPGTDALNAFSSLGGANSPMLIMSAGEFEWGLGANQSTIFLDATFENIAPALYHNLERNFMTVVAVGHANGTGSVFDIDGYNGLGSGVGKLRLSMWTDDNGTPGITSDDIIYASRRCGSMAGRGTATIDPWCFSAAGRTATEATAAAAGAFGAVKAAFSYMTNSQIFTLLALTSEGYMLGRDPGTGNVWSNRDALIAYLDNRYDLPADLKLDVAGGRDYLEAFAEAFGYGLINVERATRPDSRVYFYDPIAKTVVHQNQNWGRAASTTAWASSGVLNPRGASISAPFFDILESFDGSISLPRVFENEFALGTSDVRGLYMGDVLGEFNVRKDKRQTIAMGDMRFGMSFSEKTYTDNLNGLDNLQFGYDVGNFAFNAEYQRHFTDGISRFDGTANPVLSLASDVVSSNAEYKVGNWSLGARAFSGAMTDETLLENDPTISSRYQSARLGLVTGAHTDVTWDNGKFAVATAFGTMHENNTVLGAYTDGLLSLGAGDTMYIDTLATYRPMSNVAFTARATFAKTNTDAVGQYILGVDDIESNAFSVGADIGKFTFAMALPLSVTRGNMQYAHADYDVVEDADGNFDLVINNAGVRNLDLASENREVRFSGAYRKSLGVYTDGALGFIYRVNPNHISRFGNETILMMKLSHRVGI